MTVTDQTDREAKLAAYLSTARWYAGKGREVEIHSVRRLTMPGAGDPEVRVLVVEVTAPDGKGRDHYQVPLSYYSEPREDLSHALIGSWTDEQLGEVHAYDAVHDHHAMALWLHGFTGGAADAATDAPDHRDAVRFHVVGEPDLDPEARSTLLSGEQSNSSVFFGETAMMKLFRRVTPGINPDIEILEALTEAGSDHVATLFGWMEAEAGDDPAGDPLQLGILQQFLTTASDGWDLALASLRTLYADDETTARSSGGDFAGEAHRLGIAVAEVHETMARAFGTEQWDADALGSLADAMLARLDAAAQAVPEVAELAPALRPLLDGVRRVPAPVTAQRVHGDLHLGQTLRTVRGWKLIDFEGEPARPLAERRLPDSPWRDVAGMLRSFDYAAEGSLRDRIDAIGDEEHQAAQDARDWASRNVSAFLSGYDEVCSDDLDEALLTAYAVDKAVYEAVYEARNRPTWLPIPLAALERLAAT